MQSPRHMDRRAPAQPHGYGTKCRLESPEQGHTCVHRSHGKVTWCLHPNVCLQQLGLEINMRVVRMVPPSQEVPAAPSPAHGLESHQGVGLLSLTVPRTLILSLTVPRTLILTLTLSPTFILSLALAFALSLPLPSTLSLDPVPNPNRAPNPTLPLNLTLTLSLTLPQP